MVYVQQYTWAGNASNKRKSWLVSVVTHIWSSKVSLLSGFQWRIKKEKQFSIVVTLMAPCGFHLYCLHVTTLSIIILFIVFVEYLIHKVTCLWFYKAPTNVVNPKFALTVASQYNWEPDRIHHIQIIIKLLFMTKSSIVAIITSSPGAISYTQ